MKRPALMFGTVLAALLCGAAAPGASAQTIARTAPLNAENDGRGGLNAYFGDGFAAADSGRPFASVFTFSVAGIPFDAAASVTSSYLDAPATHDLRITGLSLYRYDPATMATIGNAVAGVDLTGFGANPVDSWSLTAFDLPAGAYAVRVDGRVVGSGGGSFGGDLSVSPVPEAPVYAMLLAGTLLLLRNKNRPAGRPGGRFVTA